MWHGVLSNSHPLEEHASYGTAGEHAVLAPVALAPRVCLPCGSDQPGAVSRQQSPGAQQNPLRVQQNAVPVQQNAVPVQQSSLPVQQKTVPVQQNPVPVQQNTLLTQQPELLVEKKKERGEDRAALAQLGVPWTPQELTQKAKECQHPLQAGAPVTASAAEATFLAITAGPSEVIKWRTSQLTGRRTLPGRFKGLAG